MKINLTANCELCSICGKIFFSSRKGRKVCSSKCKNKLNNFVATERKLIGKFNLSLENYNKIFQQQNGRCCICGKHQTELKKKLAVDHDHKTYTIRGLLCPTCNCAIGLFKDDVELLKSAINYLER